MRMKGILISEETPDINYDEINKNNISMIFIRLGYTTYGKNKEKLIDKKFYVNYKNIVKHEIPVGIYYESCAVTEKEANEEAEYFIKLIKDKKLSCPVTVLICDEHSTIIYSRKNQLNLPKKELISIVLTFCKKVEEEDINIFITSYKSWFDGNLNDGKILKYDIAILPNEFNKFENVHYQLYKDNIIYLFDNKNHGNIEIKLEKKSLINKLKILLNMPIKYIKNKLK